MTHDEGEIQTLLLQKPIMVHSTHSASTTSKTKGQYEFDICEGERVTSGKPKSLASVITLTEFYEIDSLKTRSTL